jgi:hypothetical protein
MGTRSGGVHAAFAQPLYECLGRQVHQHDLVGRGEHLVWEGLANPDTGQLEDPVVEALHVLDVDRREDVDARIEHVLDVLVALRVLDSRRVRVGQLVDQAELRGAVEDGRQVHLFDLLPPVLDLAARQDLEPIRLCRRLGAIVRLEVANHHVATRGLARLALLEHAVGLADPRRHPEEDLVAPSPVGGHRSGFC